MSGEKGDSGGLVLSVNVAKVREIPYRGGKVRTGIWKLPVPGRMAVGSEGLAADLQADRRFHGGVDKAVYAYSVEDYGWWEREAGIETYPGLFGENLTIQGLDLVGALVGERWRVGGTMLEVSEPRQPCFKLGVKMGDMRFVRRFAKALRLGAYLRVIQPGELGAGDEIDVVSVPEHDVTVQMLGRVAFGERELAPAALEVPALSEAWRGFLEEKLAR